jgi:fructose/tagatose bisphosphate aldolase
VGRVGVVGGEEDGVAHEINDKLYTTPDDFEKTMFTNYDGVLKVDGEVGVKKVYDPRSYLKKAEASMTERVIEACNDLHCAGRSLSSPGPR